MLSNITNTFFITPPNLTSYIFDKLKNQKVKYGPYTGQTYYSLFDKNFAIYRILSYTKSLILFQSLLLLVIILFFLYKSIISGKLKQYKYFSSLNYKSFSGRFQSRSVKDVLFNSNFNELYTYILNDFRLNRTNNIKFPVSFFSNQLIFVMVTSLFNSSYFNKNNSPKLFEKIKSGISSISLCQVNYSTSYDIYKVDKNITRDEFIQQLLLLNYEIFEFVVIDKHKKVSHIVLNNEHSIDNFLDYLKNQSSGSDVNNNYLPIDLNKIKAIHVDFSQFKGSKGKSNNCFFDVLKSNGINLQDNDILYIRQQIDKTKNEPIDIIDIPKIEKILNTEIYILDFLNQPINSSFLNFGKIFTEKYITMYLSNNHFYKDIPSPTKTYTKNKKNIFCFYDIETVCDDIDFKLLPYSISYCFLWEDEIDKFDFNKIKTQELLKERSYFLTVNINNCDILKDFIIHLNHYLKFYNIKVCGFNNSRFDNFFLVRKMYEFCGYINCFVVKNSIYNFNYFPHEKGGICSSFDLSLLTGPLSLKQLCIDLNANPKKLEFNHKNIQDIYSTTPLDFFMDYINDNEQLKKYNDHDIYSLIDLTRMMKLEYKKLLNVNMFDFITQAQLAGHVLKPELIRNNVIPPDNLELWKWIKESDTGGYCNCFEGEKICINNGILLDINSQYPFVCIENQFPTGKYFHTKEYIKGKLGIYLCKFNQNKLKYPLLPRKEGTNNWNYYNEQTRKITSIEIDYLMENNCDVEVIEGFYWEESSYVFRDYMNRFKTLKENIDKTDINQRPVGWESKRFIYKQMMNIVTGSVMKKYYNNTYDFVKFPNGLNEIPISFNKENQMFLVNRYMTTFDKSKISPIHLGVFIHSYARKYLHETILNRYKTYYSDTDSVILEKIEYEQILNDNPTIIDSDKTGTFGKYKVEMSFDLGYILNKKKYCLVSKDGTKIRYNGLSEKSKWEVIDKNDQIVISGSGKKNVEMFEKLINDKSTSLKIYMSSINRSFKRNLEVKHIDKIIRHKYKKKRPILNIGLNDLGW
jgi:hypothetical protein